MVPVAGSAYTYAYATLGELFAWIIGWDLILEYAVASVTVAHGWSKNFQDIIAGRRRRSCPRRCRNAPFDYDPALGPASSSTGSVLDLPAILIAVARHLGAGASASARAPASTPSMVIAQGRDRAVRDRRRRVLRQPRQLDALRALRLHGHQLLRQDAVRARPAPGGEPLGMLAGAAVIFFAYIGFDSVSTHAEEAQEPAARRADRHHRLARHLHGPLHRGGRRAHRHGARTTRSTSRRRSPTPSAGRPALGALPDRAGAVAGITSVLLVMMLSQPRVLLAMARDGLVPPIVLRRRAPEVPHAVEVDDPHRRLRGHRRRPSCPCASWPS